MQIISPALMESETSFSIFSPVKLLLIFSMAIIIIFSQRAIPDKCTTAASISLQKLYCRWVYKDKQEKYICKVEKHISEMGVFAEIDLFKLLTGNKGGGKDDPLFIVADHPLYSL